MGSSRARVDRAGRRTLGRGRHGAQCLGRQGSTRSVLRAPTPGASARWAMAPPTAAGPDLERASGLPIFQEVLDSLLHEGSLEQTLSLISRRVTELAAFDFCGIVLPDADWTHLRLAASHAFPPRYAGRLSDTFLA